MLDIRNCNNMDLMREFPDKHFDLAIVDPPYGIGAESGFGQSKTKKTHSKIKKWDSQTPKKEYFLELFRVSKNQIIFGANYFIEQLGSCRCFICWDKQQQGKNFSDCEFAWTSFDTVAKLITVRYLEPHECNIYNTVKRIHPTQKPVKLYQTILDSFAKPSDKILDTHLGSGSIAIACHDYGFDLTACELDKEYFDKAMERINNHVAQQKLF